MRPHCCVLLFGLCGFALSSVVSYTLDTHKKPRLSGGSLEHEYQKSNLFWGSIYTVGAGKNVTLEIDTGSDNLILNSGVYKPSSYSKAHPNDHFAIYFEGANKAGRGVEYISGTTVQDVVSDGVLKIYNQTIGKAKHFKYVGVNPDNKATAGFDGIMGWEGARQSPLKPRPGSWFYNLCKQGLISECRFGLALGTHRKGKHVVGKLDRSLFKEDLTFAPLYGLWNIRADITLNNEIVIKNQIIDFDVGTTNMQSGSDAARKIFNMLGYHYRRISSGPGYEPYQKKLHFVDATYPCDAKPPLLGISIPAEHDLQTSSSNYMSRKAKIFNMLPLEWEFKNHGHNNCTAVLAGTNAFANKQGESNAWLFGQPFFQGHYLDFHIGNGIGIGDLVNTKTGAAK